MKHYMAMYTGNPATFDKWQKDYADPKKRAAKEQEGMNAWNEWGKKHAGAIVDRLAAIAPDLAPKEALHV